MLANATKLAIISGAVWMLAASADAQQIDQRCMTMKDKVGCTCAVQNGGGIGRRPGTNRKRWYSKRGGQTHVNEAFVQCMIRNGRG
ncbi:MAG: hypothetical protein K2Y71_03675 [Xanthobacteraceae bacterium]|nr:hypothetical protein [Xanthobacteraceae bacterium]